MQQNKIISYEYGYIDDIKNIRYPDKYTILINDIYSKHSENIRMLQTRYYVFSVREFKIMFNLMFSNIDYYRYDAKVHKIIDFEERYLAFENKFVDSFDSFDELKSHHKNYFEYLEGIRNFDKIQYYKDWFDNKVNV